MEVILLQLKKRNKGGQRVMEKKFIFKNNAFDLIRYWAAITVMLGHFVWKASPYARGNIALRDIGKMSTFFPGVVILFSMSGFLISASFERSKDKKEFFTKRVLRMYPELWVCTIVNLVVMCLLAYKLLDKSIFVWLGTQVFGIAYTPSCLKGFATGSVNGALWTIFTELQLYIALGIIYNWIKKFETKKWIVLLIFLAACNLGANYVTNNFGSAAGKIVERFFLTYALWFFIGVFCYVRKERVVPLLKKWVIPLLLLYIFCKLLPIELPGYYSNIAIGILLPLIVIGGGYCLPSIRISCDITYEIFLYHWIVLNVIIHFDLINKLSWGIALVIFCTMTFVLAWLSWRFVGKGGYLGTTRQCH